MNITAAQQLRATYLTVLQGLSHQERCATLYRKVLAHQKEWIISYIMDEMHQIDKDVVRQEVKQVVDGLFYQAKKYFYTPENIDDAISAVLEQIITTKWFKDENLQDRTAKSILGLLQYSKIPQVLQNIKKTKSTKTKEKELYQRSPKDDESYSEEQFYQKPDQAMKEFQRTLSKAEWDMIMQQFDDYMENRYVLRGKLEGWHPLDLFDRYVDGEGVTDIAQDISSVRGVNVDAGSIQHVIDMVGKHLKKFLHDQAGNLTKEDLFQGV